MADRYAVATGNWNSTGTWSTTSGGASGASVPILGDTARLDNALFTVTVSAVATCDNILVSAGILTISNIRTLNLMSGISIVSGTGLVIATTGGTGIIRLASGVQLNVQGTTAQLGGSGNGTLAIGPSVYTIPAVTDVRNGVVYGLDSLVTGTLVVGTGDILGG